MQSFDYAKFKAGFRAAAAKRGIDSETGATSYQVANIISEREKARKAKAATNWWKSREMWHDPGDAHSTTEMEAIDNIRRACGWVGWSLSNGEEAQWLVWALRDIKRELREGMTLKELHRLRGVEIQWIDVGTHAKVPVEMPIKGAA